MRNHSRLRDRLRVGPQRVIRESLHCVGDGGEVPNFVGGASELNRATGNRGDGPLDLELHGALNLEALGATLDPFGVHTGPSDLHQCIRERNDDLVPLFVVEHGQTYHKGSA